MGVELTEKIPLTNTHQKCQTPQHPKDKKTYQMISSVLTESNVESTLPDLIKQERKLNDLVKMLSTQMENKSKQLKEFTANNNLNPEQSKDPQLATGDKKSTGILVG